ncbi:MAG: hypothetical protein Q4B60_08145 [Erysipelotrichaceae bacterium]|nr:hypothetical protein [Erysipelotrichaceae bacterium]
MLNNKQTCQLIAKSYRMSIGIIREHENGYHRLLQKEIEPHYHIVNRVNEVVEGLDILEGLIIENEIIKGKKDNWYIDFLSYSTYKRHVDKAYSEFLKNLED